MPKASTGEHFKKVVGKARPDDVWDRLYRLNQFTAALQLPNARSDGYPVQKLLVSLAKADVRFIVVGGLAVALNGFVRTTEDVDILVDSAPDNIDALLGALSSFGAGHARELTRADFDESEGAIRVIEDFPLDIFTVMRGRRFVDLRETVHTTAVERCTISYLDAPTLIALKENSQREKDQIDVAALRAL